MHRRGGGKGLIKKIIKKKKIENKSKRENKKQEKAKLVTILHDGKK